MSVLLQVYILIIMLIWGAILGVIFDVYRFLLPTNKVKGIAQYLFDIAFWLIITIFTFTIIVFANYGEVRIYLILGILLGFIIYSALFSKRVMKILSYLKKIVIYLASIAGKVFRSIYRLLSKFSKLLYKLLGVALLPIHWLLNIFIKPLATYLKKIYRNYC